MKIKIYIYFFVQTGKEIYSYEIFKLFSKSIFTCHLCAIFYHTLGYIEIKYLGEYLENDI